MLNDVTLLTFLPPYYVFEIILFISNRINVQYNKYIHIPVCVIYIYVPSLLFTYVLSQVTVSVIIATKLTI
jgi:hypothetical protein